MSERRPKYNARKTTVDGITFDSAAEARRYSQLKLLEAAGEITVLELQPIFRIVVNGKRVCNYIGDFLYLDKDGLRVVEDVKSEMTRKLPVYRLKKKLMLAVYGIEIQEVEA